MARLALAPTVATLEGAAVTIAIVSAVIAVFIACYFICKKRYVALSVPCVVVIAELVLWNAGILIPKLASFLDIIIQQFQQYFWVGENVLANKICLLLCLGITGIYYYLEYTYRTSRIDLDGQMRQKLSFADEEYKAGPDVDSAKAIVKNWYLNELKKYETRLVHMNVLAFLVAVSRLVMLFMMPVCLVTIGVVEQVFIKLSSGQWFYSEFAQLKREIFAKRKSKILEVNFQIFERISWAVIFAMEVAGVFYTWDIYRSIIYGLSAFVLVMLAMQVKVLYWQGQLKLFSPAKSVKPKVVLSARTFGKD